MFSGARYEHSVNILNEPIQIPAVSAENESEVKLKSVSLELFS